MSPRDQVGPGQGGDVGVEILDRPAHDDAPALPSGVVEDVGPEGDDRPGGHRLAAAPGPHRHPSSPSSMANDTISSVGK